MRRIAFFIFCFLTLTTALCEAVEVELWPRTVFQLQQLRDVDRLKIDKTRFTQYLTLNLYEKSDAPNHLFFSSLRVDADLGRDNSPDASPDPLRYQSFALMYAYYEWRRIGDLVDLTVGRQILTDELGMAAMDGLKLSIYHSWHVGLELYSGFEIKGALNADSKGFELPNSDTFEPDGLTGDDRLTGVFGAAIFLHGIENTQARLHYRHRYSGETDGYNLGLSFRQRIFGFWDLYTTDDFNLFTERFNQLNVGARFDFDWISFSLDHATRFPNFDADSIFNLFDIHGEKELAARFYVRPDRRTHLNLGYSRIVQANDFPLFDSWGREGNAGNFADLGLTRSIGQSTEIRAGYRMGMGWGGDQHRFRLGAGTAVWNRRIRLDGDWMGTYYEKLLYTDILEGARNKGFSMGVRVQSDFRLVEEVSLKLMGDVYSNDLIERQFAFFAVLDVHAWQ